MFNSRASRFDCRLAIALIAIQTTAFAEIGTDDCARAAKYSESNRGIAMLVMQNGRTIFEHYPAGSVRNGRWPIFSGTKSFWGIAALCAVRNGLITLDDHVCDTITEWKTDARKSRITIRQLLTQTDGIEGAPHLHRASIRDRNAMAVRLSALAEPGTRFIYGPSHLQIFVELLRRKLNGGSPIAFLSQNVTGPLGLTNLEFKRDGRGNPLPATGFELSAAEWARLGELILGHGEYHGQQIVPSGLLQQAFAGTGPNPAYGFTFWLNRQAPRASEIDVEKELDLPWERARWANVCICRSAPPDMVVGLGSNQQRLYVIPSLNAIIVRQGQGSRFSDARFLRLLLRRG